jgi:hypothetical protein
LPKKGYFSGRQPRILGFKRTVSQPDDNFSFSRLPEKDLVHGKWKSGPLGRGSQVMAPPLLSVPYGGLLKGRQGRSGALWNGSEALKRFTGQPQKDIAIDTVILPACAGPAVSG